VKLIKAYEIDVIRLKDGRHAFKFEVGDKFFEYYQANDWLNGANIGVDVNLTKTVSVMEVDFHIHGTVNLTCDRSLEPFDEPLDLHEKVVYKYGPVEEEISEDVFMITKDTPSVNVAQLIYEYILLAIPAKKIHPDHRTEADEEDDEEYDSEVEAFLVEIEEEEDEDEERVSDDEEPSEEKVDPRWDILKKLKNKE
jgi:uncharacterized metal-binding protein YceD (DUF177 family)